MNNLLKYSIIVFMMISYDSAAQKGLPAGYPDSSPSFDVLPGFINPPKGYGEVPFYWWQGDTITRERLLWQLDKLNNKGISSLQINYSHRDFGGLSYGLSNPSKPGLFTDAWWDLFKWFSAEARKRNMTVSLSDYTIGVGQGFSMDEAIKNNPDLNGSLLKSITYILSSEGKLKLPENLLSLTAFRIQKDSSVIVNSRKSILDLVKGGTLFFNFGKASWKVIAVFPEKVVPSFDPMNPMSGQAYNSYFFDKFENALPVKGSERLNFFFSDELNFRLSGYLWNDGFAQEFKKRKGYDLTPFLDALFIGIGPITPKIKLDYNDVIVALSEENFFKPVYQWHQDRGMIFGCDHGGRGRDLTEFGDYFRTQRWNQGPGSDQPRLSKDIIKAKVASSIAHLYNRPRVWLEGFHSSGWSTSSADVTDAIFANFIAGYNLLSFHGLYYSTMGGWWEWAPPDNHFRMPYWNQIDPLMNSVQRLSFLLSQGTHSCDVAIIYPTETVVAEMDGDKSADIAFETGEKLYDKGIDFDFIDFESIARSEIRNGEIQVSGERYKVLIVPSMKAIRYTSLLKIEEFKRAGGIIVNIGDLPVATEKNGFIDPVTSDRVKSIFSMSSNMMLCNDANDVPRAISGKYEAGFRVLTELKDRPYTIHRKAGKRDIYSLYNFPEGSRCYFNAKGTVQLWNPWDGKIASLKRFAMKSGAGTEVTLPLTSKEIQIIVFDPDETDTCYVYPRKKIIRETELGKTWEFELKPSLDNTWGDFELPAGNELLGAQVRQLLFSEGKNYSEGQITPDTTWEKITCGFGPQFLKLGPLPGLPPANEIAGLNPSAAGEEAAISGTKYKWEEYQFSWQFGVEGDYGHQGYHGLKGEMYDNFIRLGDMEDVRMSLKRVPESKGNYYLLYTSVIAPDAGTFDILSGDIKPASMLINNIPTDTGKKTIALNKGSNHVLLIYDRACETYLVFRKHDAPEHIKQPVSMRWYKDYGVLPFNAPDNGNKIGLYAFESAPGLQSIKFAAYGKINVSINGDIAQVIVGNVQPDGLTEYRVDVKDVRPASSKVVIKIEYLPGYQGAGAIPQYIRQICGLGEIALGDWSKTDGLRSYSGGAWYRKMIIIDKQDLLKNMEIDLGDLVSCAELFINGKSAGIRLSPPWTYDISGYVMEGENKIEVLVYNTLANHYTSIPTRYRGDIKSGLTGPVKLRLFSTE